jgi:hypothetical protein
METNETVAGVGSVSSVVLIHPSGGKGESVTVEVSRQG